MPFIFSSSAQSLDNYDIYNELNKSTVRINIWKDYEANDAHTVAGGSGVIINEKNGVYFILTNAHVLLEKFCLFKEASVEESCVNKFWDEKFSILVDTPDTKFDYLVSYDDIMYWANYDFAVIRLNMNNYVIEDQFHDFSPIIIGGNWYPLLKVFGSGFPSILGNYEKNYASMVFCSGVVNTLFTDEHALDQLSNYSIAHSCNLANGMSGGPLVDEDGKLLGINGLSGVTDTYSDEQGELEYIDIAAARFDYAMDIWDLYNLEILSTEDEPGHFNSNSIFYQYLPKLSHDYHSSFYESYIDLHPNKKTRIDLLFQ